MPLPASIIRPAALGSLYDSMNFVSSCARELGFADDRITEIELAMEEVLVNIFNYAYRDLPEAGNVVIRCERGDSESLIIEVRDSGVPFDIFAVSEPDMTSEINDRKIGGLGVFLVKKLMDDVRYRRDADSNILTLAVRHHERAV